jgi:hypothetical protein
VRSCVVNEEFLGMESLEVEKSVFLVIAISRGRRNCSFSSCFSLLFHYFACGWIVIVSTERLKSSHVVCNIIY